MNNMDIYSRYAAVPQEAMKKITGGRLNGMTDINPMWRIRCLTEAFGACGIGWYTKIMDKRIEQGGNDEKSAFVDVELYIKVDGEWSMPICGTGGSSFVSKESKGLYTSDEAFKMAYTDALSVCCKLLGFGADVYWQAGRTKYTKPEPKEQPTEHHCSKCNAPILPTKRYSVDDLIEMGQEKFGGEFCFTCLKKLTTGNDNAG
ncbi:MAG: hypothetical protein IIY72_09965 [Solobacterium sp.]|nr:hypothetical protein [Solobacterium sp.]